MERLEVARAAWDGERVAWDEQVPAWPTNGIGIEGDFSGIQAVTGTLVSSSRVDAVAATVDERFRDA